MSQVFNSYQFWNNIDKINPYKSTRQLCLKANVNYHNICQQRSDGYLPKPETLLLLSKAMAVSMETLLTGEESHIYKSEVEEIAKWLQLFGTPEDFEIIRRLLRMPGKNTAISTAG